MKKVLLPILAALALTGCATKDYELYADSHAKIEIAKANADAERYKAMGAIAQSGDASAKVAAVVALALGQSGTKAETPMTAPQNNQALQWASILVPSVTQLYGISANMRTAIAQSDNASKVAVSTNDAFVGIAGKIQAPAASVTTTNTLSGTGVLGSGTYTTSADNHAVDSHASAVDNHTTNPSLVVPQTSTARVCSVDAAGLMTCI
jgi:hypothetical protein